MNLIEKVFKSPLFRLVYTTRYSGFRLIKSESVSDHVWGMISLAFEIIPELNNIILKDIKYTGTEYNLIDLREVIYRITLHDLDESLSCDIPRPFKYANEEILRAIRDTTNAILNKRFDNNLVKEISNAKDQNVLEGLLVSIFDTLQANLYMRTEVDSGNRILTSELHNSLKTLNNFISLIDESELFDKYGPNLKNFIKSFIYEFGKELENY